MRVVVVGAGVGGLASAIKLRQAGHDVVLVEAAPQTGGLASKLELDGVTFDGGPYILLDRPGLEWVFESLGTSLDAHLHLKRLEHPWRVTWPDGNKMDVFDDVDRTADGFDAHADGAGKHYRAFIRRMSDMYDVLAPLQKDPPQGLMAWLRPSRLAAASFLRRPLEYHLKAAGLPLRVLEALAIWTRIAGQRFATAPGIMALIPAMVHRHGAWVVEGGMHKIPEALTQLALEAGVEIRCDTRAERIITSSGAVTGVALQDGTLEADVVVSNAAALSTLFELLDSPVASHKSRWGKLPLQSPGVSAYVTAEHDDVPFLQFRLGALDCSARIVPGVVDPTQRGQVRLLRTLRHGKSEADAKAAVDGLLEAKWWREGLSDPTVRGARTPSGFAAAANLYRESLHPAMTQAFMRDGRIPRQVPEVRGLVLAGSATHPGQWVSLCAMSGVLAAQSIE